MEIKNENSPSQKQLPTLMAMNRISGRREIEVDDDKFRVTLGSGDGPNTKFSGATRGEEGNRIRTRTRGLSNRIEMKLFNNFSY